MSDLIPPEPGMVLKPEWEEVYADWLDFEGCYCHALNMPPCSSCTHEGNPVGLNETPEAWESGLVRVNSNEDT